MGGTKTFLKSLVAVALAALGACGGSGGSDGGGGPTAALGLVSTPKAMLELRQKATCDALKPAISESIANLFLSRPFPSCPDCMVTMATGGVVQPALGTDAASFDAFTGTNNQESGVDELDVVEADAAGNFYIVDGDYLVVANGLPPASLRQIAALELTTDGHVDGLVLDPENRRVVAVVSHVGLFEPVPLMILPPTPSDPIVELVFVDVADPTNPIVNRRLKIEGFELAIRRIDNRIHTVTHHEPFLPKTISTDSSLLDLRDQYMAAKMRGDTAAADSLERRIRARITDLVAALDVKELLPGLMLKEGDLPYADIAAPNCADVAVPDVPFSLALTSVTSIDSDGTNAASLMVVSNAWNVYASEQSVYLMQTSSGWWFSERQRQQTAIYKIAIGAGTPVYRAFGAVDGWAASSFQFSEHEDFLRVATNRWELDPASNFWLQDNNLYVLADNSAGSLDVVGSVLGFGRGERIFSARFLGDRGFVVTFRQIDPLFAFDLSNPRDPRLAGEVEVPGVSTYIHPLDETHLLTIGRDGDQNRLNGDFQLQIFDVQNLDEPRLVHKYVPQFSANGFAWTPALWDHLAFNYFPSAGTLTVPIQYYASQLDEHFSGFVAFSVSVANGFAELGRVDHSDLARRVYCTTTDGTVPAICTSGFYLRAANPRRSVSGSYSGETYIYTLSDVGMKVSVANSFGTPLAVLPLPYDDHPRLMPQ
jgi:hypothetical protein